MSIIVFIRYKESVKDFFGRDHFKDGKILWAGHNAVPWASETENWDEILIIKYFSQHEEKKAIERLAEEPNIKKSKVLSLNLISPVNLDKLNALLKSFLKTSIDMTQGDISEWAEGGPNDPSLEQLKHLMQKDMGKPVTIVNLLKFKDIATYPKDFKGKRGRKGKNFTGKEAHERYSNKFMKVIGKGGARFITVGNINAVLFGDGDSGWETFSVVNYPSLNKLLEIIGSKILGPSLTHRDAGLEKTKINIASPYEEYY